MNDTHLNGEILKRDDEERLVWGWAYVSTIKGELALDHSGETIAPDVLAKAATDFMLDVRAGHFMHMDQQIGVVVHSLPVTKELAEALGIRSEREGWIIGVVVNDETLARVESGELTSFSIGGRALKRSL